MDASQINAYDVWTAAELHWMAEIKAAYPNRRAGDLRYLPEGKGQPGTALSAAHAAWDDARRAWEIEREKGLVLLDM